MTGAARLHERRIPQDGSRNQPSLARQAEPAYPQDGFNQKHFWGLSINKSLFTHTQQPR